MVDPVVSRLLGLLLAEQRSPAWQGGQGRGRPGKRKILILVQKIDHIELGSTFWQLSKKSKFQIRFSDFGGLNVVVIQNL